MNILGSERIITSQYFANSLLFLDVPLWKSNLYCCFCKIIFVSLKHTVNKHRPQKSAALRHAWKNKNILTIYRIVLAIILQSLLYFCKNIDSIKRTNLSTSYNLHQKALYSFLDSVYICKGNALSCVRIFFWTKYQEDSLKYAKTQHLKLS